MNTEILIGENLTLNNQDKICQKLKLIHNIATLFFFGLTIGFILGLQDINVIPSTSFSVGDDGPIGTPSQQIYNNANFNPCLFIIFFVLLAAIDHGIISYAMIYHLDCVKNYLFKKKNNPIRWIEYSFSSTLMLLSICILCGVSDVHMWVLLTICNSIGMLFGNVIELLSSPENNSFSNHNEVIIKWVYWLTSALVFLPWSVPLSYFFHGVYVLNNSPTDANIPSFVYIALLGTLVCFMTFGVNSYLYSIAKRYDFHQTEYIYVILSFTAKFLLAVDVYGGLSSASQ